MKCDRRIGGTAVDTPIKWRSDHTNLPRYRATSEFSEIHDDVIKWKHFPRYWPFVRGIHRSPVNSPHKGQWHRALMFTLICAWINGWVNNGKAGDLRRYRAHYDVIVMQSCIYNWGIRNTNQRVGKWSITGWSSCQVQLLCRMDNLPWIEGREWHKKGTLYGHDEQIIWIIHW